MSCKQCGNPFGEGTAYDHTVVTFGIRGHRWRGEHPRREMVSSSRDSGEFCSTACLRSYLEAHYGPEGDFYRPPDGLPGVVRRP
jgi:hypothetical protein